MLLLLLTLYITGLIANFVHVLLQHARGYTSCSYINRYWDPAVLAPSLMLAWHWLPHLLSSYMLCVHELKYHSYNYACTILAQDTHTFLELYDNGATCTCALKILWPELIISTTMWCTPTCHVSTVMLAWQCISSPFSVAFFKYPVLPSLVATQQWGCYSRQYIFMS